MTLAQIAGIALASFLLTWAAVKASIAIAHRSDLLDHPDGNRKQQAAAIPKLGGVAVAVALCLAVTLGLAILGRWQEMGLALSVLLPAALAATIGFADDVRDLNPYLRLVLQAGVGLLAYVLGTRITITGMWPLDLALTTLWIVLIINGVNLLDNSDGLAGSTALVAALSSLIISVAFGQQLVALLAASLIGSAGGFLVHNWHPARVYLGDSGAYFLGASIAILAIRLRPEGMNSIVAALVALLILALPLGDTGYVTVKRLRAGVHPFTAGRDHLSHRLQGFGLTVPRSVLILQFVSLMTGGIAVALAVASV